MLGLEEMYSIVIDVLLDVYHGGVPFERLPASIVCLFFVFHAVVSVRPSVLVIHIILLGLSIIFSSVSVILLFLSFPSVLEVILLGHYVCLVDVVMFCVSVYLLVSDIILLCLSVYLPLPLMTFSSSLACSSYFVVLFSENPDA